MVKRRPMSGSGRGDSPTVQGNQTMRTNCSDALGRRVAYGGLLVRHETFQIVRVEGEGKG